jgi:hypothetical protein
LFSVILLCVAAGACTAYAAGEFPGHEGRKFGPGDVNTTIDSEAGKAAIVSFKELGVVDLIAVSYPPTDGADNGTIEHFLVNGTPAAVPVERTAAAKVDIKGDPKYSKFIKMNPNLVLSAAGVEFEKVQPLEGDELRYYFLFVLRDDGDVAGYARIAFDFDKDGKFIEADLIKLMKTRQRL